MKVRLVGYTQSHRNNMSDVSDERWEAEGDGDAADLVEFAGRQCYESWDRPNPATATRVGYIGNLVAQKHLSVLEHGAVSFHVSDVSRSLTHELVRHRHFSFSQVSQRYVNPVDGVDRGFVLPPLFKDDPEAARVLWRAWSDAVAAYRLLLARAEYLCDEMKLSSARSKKMAREAARAVLPNMTPTALVVTANHHAWFDWLGKRGTIHADQEIRALAVDILRLLQQVEPAIYMCWEITEYISNGYKTQVITHVG